MAQSSDNGAVRGVIGGIDHALVGVRDLEQARIAYQRLGFTVSPRGRHIGWGTANYCIMFQHDYIELLGIIDPDKFSNDLDVFLQTREGLLGAALATDDAAVAARAFKVNGIEAGEPRGLQRVLELPGGDVLPAFKLVHLDPSETPGIPAFACQHLTREMVWQDPWIHHPNSAQGLRAITAVVEDPSAVALPYARLFGFDRVRAGDGVVEVDSGTAWLRFTSADQLQRLHPGLEDVPDYPRPWIAALRVSVANVEVAAAYLRIFSQPFVQDSHHLLRISPEVTCGVLLELEELSE